MSNQPRIFIPSGPCCWKCTRPAGKKIKVFYKKLKSKAVRRILNREIKNEY